jgi:hypothetical protein
VQACPYLNKSSSHTPTQQEAEEDMSRSLALDSEMRDEVDEMREDIRALKSKDRAADAQLWRRAFR